MSSTRYWSLRVWLALALALTSSCGGEDPRDGEPQERLGTVRQAITDTDSDGLDDGWETTHFGGLAQTGSGDFDSDGMTNLEEYTNAFNPTVNDAFEDADGDRYPNIFELRRSSDPNSATSVPTANYVVDVNGGGTHTSLSAAYNASSTTNGAYQIIGVAPGTYTAAANDLTLATSKEARMRERAYTLRRDVRDAMHGRRGWPVRPRRVARAAPRRARDERPS